MKFLSIFLLINMSQYSPIVAEPKTVWVEEAIYHGNQEISVSFSYSGGCAEHQFELQVSPICTRSYPQQCFAEIVEVNPVRDLCEAYITETMTFTLDSEIFEQPTVLILRSGERDIFPIEINID